MLFFLIFLEGFKYLLQKSSHLYIISFLILNLIILRISSFNILKISSKSSFGKLYIGDLEIKIYLLFNFLKKFLKFSFIKKSSTVYSNNILESLSSILICLFISEITHTIHFPLNIFNLSLRFSSEEIISILLNCLSFLIIHSIKGFISVSSFISII